MTFVVACELSLEIKEKKHKTKGEARGHARGERPRLLCRRRWRTTKREMTKNSSRPATSAMVMGTVSDAAATCFGSRIFLILFISHASKNIDGKLLFLS